MSGIISYGTYVPYWRLNNFAIALTVGVMPGKGTRSVASYDEDATSMGVEAAREALAGTLDGAGARALYFATARPAYLDKTNACAIHAALGLDRDAPAVDMVGSVRSGVGALRAALDASVPTLVVLSDVRAGLAGSTDEREGGDGAAALVCGSGDGGLPVIAEYLGGASTTEEFLDRWRAPAEFSSRVWEERFGEHAYLPLARDAMADAFKRVGITPDQVDHLIVTGTQSRSVSRAAKASGVKAEALVDNLSTTVGNTGTAHPGLLLASALDKASPGQVIALMVLADGADVLLFRTTDALPERRQRTSVEQQIASSRDDLVYPKMLTWRGLLRMEPPRRPDPDAPCAPPSFRSEDWKFAFVGSRCEACGTRHLPPQRTCQSCRATDQMRPVQMRDVKGTVTTYTIDRLAFSENPPACVGVIDFDGGGRYQCELTDVNPDTIRVGDRVEMTFRRMFQAGNGVSNYFWKARPIRGGN